jgi:purine-binding chemotaxis protein CheW
VSVRTKSDSAVREREILEERARILARPPPVEVQAADWLELLVFSLSGETYALETRSVREVSRFADFTAVPGASPFLLGVTNLRGEILPVFDLRQLAGIAPKGLTDLSRLLVLGEDREELGLLADEVREVKRMRREEILDPPEELAAIGRALLLGVTKEAVIVLDGAGLLRDERLFL